MPWHEKESSTNIDLGKEGTREKEIEKNYEYQFCIQFGFIRNGNLRIFMSCVCNQAGSENRTELPQPSLPLHFSHWELKMQWLLSFSGNFSIWCSITFIGGFPSSAHAISSEQWKLVLSFLLVALFFRIFLCLHFDRFVISWRFALRLYKSLFFYLNSTNQINLMFRVTESNQGLQGSLVFLAETYGSLTMNLGARNTSPVHSLLIWNVTIKLQQVKQTSQMLQKSCASTMQGKTNLHKNKHI